MDEPRRLLTKIRERQRTQQGSPQGLDTLLDMCALTEDEYMVYVRKSSLLLAKMELLKAKRTPDEWIKAREDQLRRARYST